MMTKFTYCDMDMRWPDPAGRWASFPHYPPYYRFNALALFALDVSIGFGGWIMEGRSALIATERTSPDDD